MEPADGQEHTVARLQVGLPPLQLPPAGVLVEIHAVDIEVGRPAESAIPAATTRGEAAIPRPADR